MSFSQQNLISKITLNEQIQQPFFKFENDYEENWSKSQYPFFTNQLHSNISPYLSTSNNIFYTNLASPSIKQEVVNESQIFTESSFQNVDDIVKEIAEINQKEKSFSRRNYKLNRNFLKRKRNFYLRSLIQYPKSALTLLKEVYPQLKIKVTKQLYGTKELYTSEINIDGYEFMVTDLKKDHIIERACEEVIKTIFFKKVFDFSLNNAEGDIDMNESYALTESSEKKIQEENQFWSLLARYAIFKLFSKWNKQEIPIPKLSEVEFVPGIIYKKHPVQLLHEIRPDWKFIEERDGVSPYSAFKASIFADNHKFIGTGRSKKLARKDCAENILKALGVKYL